jgi:branched-chain amino acid aminotransferase
MTPIQLHSDALESVKTFKLPQELGFGSVLTPIMIYSDYENGKWGPLKMEPYKNLSINPTMKVLHYAQEIFEGMKGYLSPLGEPLLFRPEMNAQRFNYSAKMMAMPEIPEHTFLSAAHAITHVSKDLIPTESGSSLYIRPFMYATDTSLGIKPSETFRFMTIASPSTSYFKPGDLNVFIERNAARACPGGVGTAKTGGNYAASLKSSTKAVTYNCQQTLWLDALEHKSIEEMSGMNFMAIENGKLITPELTDTILAGITRDSIIKIAPTLGLEVEERKVEINPLLEKFQAGSATEAFACGTAVIIAPISKFVEENEKETQTSYPTGNWSMKIRSRLLDIQEGRIEGPLGWSVKVEKTY